MAKSFLARVAPSMVKDSDSSLWSQPACVWFGATESSCWSIHHSRLLWLSTFGSKTVVVPVMFSLRCPLNSSPTIWFGCISPRFEVMIDHRYFIPSSPVSLKTMIISVKERRYRYNTEELKWKYHTLYLNWKWLLNTGKGLVTMINLVAMSSPSNQVVALTYCFPLKDTRTSWRTGWFQIWSEKHIRWTWNILSYQIVSKLPVMTGVMSKGLRSLLEGAVTDQRWGNLNFNKDKNWNS